MLVEQGDVLKLFKESRVSEIVNPSLTSIGGRVDGGAIAMHIYACRTRSLATCIAYLRPCGREATRWWGTTCGVKWGVMHFTSTVHENCNRHWYASRSRVRSFFSLLFFTLQTTFRRLRWIGHYSLLWLYDIFFFPSFWFSLLFILRDELITYIISEKITGA